MTINAPSRARTATLERRVLHAASDWSRIGQIATRVGIDPKQARDVVRLLVAQGQLERMGSSPVNFSPKPAYRRVTPIPRAGR